MRATDPARTVLAAALLELAPCLPVAHVGASGARRARPDRDARLREVGVTGPEPARLGPPLGRAPGARTPEGTALSVAAETVADRAGPAA
ncbi:hypothetical protein GCM10010266_29410 [Streptomyces griseomycini]|nr:hypothetical protein GCM10010266_29410 [Streptomyces griseomycini]